MKVVCSWCSRVMTPGPPAPVSHTICESCLAKVLEAEAA